MNNKQLPSKKKPVQVRPLHYVAALWVASLLSLGLLYAAGSAVVSDFKSFRSCATNSDGLVVSGCGKQAFNPGDAVLIGLFILAAFLVLSVATATWRATKGKA